MTTPAIRVEGLTKTYGDVVALDGLDLQISGGEVFALLGPNGAGKSTLTRILVTLAAPTAGRAEVLGHPVSTEPDAIRAAIGYAPQELALDVQLSARENLRYFAGLYGLARGDAARRIEELLDDFGLSEAAGRTLRTYSGGMKKRAALAAALVHRPSVLFLDEPSLGLDVEGRRSVWRRVRALRDEGTTVLLCTNYLDEAEALCDRLAIVDAGRKVVEGRPESLKEELGGDVLVLETGDDGAGAAERLAEAVRELEFVRETTVVDGSVSLLVEENETAIPRAMAAAREAGIDVAAVRYSRPTLEDVFLHWVGRPFSSEGGAVRR